MPALQAKGQATALRPESAFLTMPRAAVDPSSTIGGNPSAGACVEEAAIDKSDRRVRRMFASIARRYDLLNHLLSLNIDRSWRPFTTLKVPPQPGVPVLDCCTGTADLALAYDRAAAVRPGGRDRLLPRDAGDRPGQGAQVPGCEPRRPGRGRHPELPVPE